MGSGPASLANAAVLSRRGFVVKLFNPPDYPSDLTEIQRLGGFEIEGSLGDEFVRISCITTNIQQALRTVQLIIISVPGYAQMLMAQYCLPYLKPGHILLLMPGSAGSLEVATFLTRAGFSLDEILLGETASVSQSSRRVGESRLRIKLPSKVQIAAFPGKNTSRLVSALGDILSMNPKPNVLYTGLNNPNFLIHPGPMLLNYADVERRNGFLSLMNEGMTDGALRLLDAVDAEKMSLQRALGLEVIDIDTLYVEKGAGPYVYREKGEPFGLRDQIWDRYVDEDVPYGTVLFSSLGDLLGIETKVCDAINSIFSAIKKTNYWETGRTLKKMGINGMSIDELQSYLMTGRTT